MSKRKVQSIRLDATVDPLNPDVTIRDLIEALEKAGAMNVEVTGTSMRLLVAPEIGGES